MFQDELKNTRLKEKTFNSSAEVDPQTEFGKAVFAKSVVKPNSNNIDFSGFDPLLDRIIAVLDHFHTTRVGSDGKRTLRARETEDAEALSGGDPLTR